MFARINLIIVLLEVGIISGFLLQPNTTEAPCVDVNAACDAFDICNIDFHTAKQQCRKYCDLCDVVDGGWSFWGSWGTCSTTCGDGTRTRTRTCDNPSPANRGDDCPGSQLETSTCLMNTCPVHGGWGVWSTWGICSTSCGIGLRRRDRACDSPWPTKDGNHCFGESLTYEICSDYQCAIGWTSWSGWGGCSSTCGPGTQSRTRTCHNPAVSALNNSCPGDSNDYRGCSDSSCSSAFLAQGITVINGSEFIAFPRVIFNDGGDYNKTSGVFTCRIPGLYSIYAGIGKAVRVNTSFIECFLKVNGREQLQMYSYTPTDVSDGLISTISGAFRLKQGDLVQIGRCSHQSLFYNGYLTYFSVILIQPDL